MKFFIFQFCVLILALNDSGAANVKNNDGESEKVVVKLFYETLCPYCRQDLPEMWKPMTLKLQNSIDNKLYPYGNAQTIKKKGKIHFECQHGPDECYGNKLHDCAIKYISNITEVVLFNACMMERDGVGSNDEGADACGKKLNISTDKIKNCAKTQEGDDLHWKYGIETKKEEVFYVPYMTINGVEFLGDDLIAAVCAAFKNPPPECHE